MNMKKIYLSLLLHMLLVPAIAQITGPTTATVGTPVSFTTPKAGNQFVWAFDSVNVNSAITTASTSKRILINHASLQGSCTPVVYDSSNGHYYSFWGTWNNAGGLMYRMDFGANPLSTPTVTTVSNSGMGFTGTDNGNMDLVYDAPNSTWWMFWGGRGSGGSQLLRVNFGSSLANTPVSGSTMTFAELGYPFQVTVKKYGNEWLLFSASNWGSVSRFDFGSSLAGTPTATTLPGTMANLGYFSLYEQDGSWYMVMVGTVSAKAWRYDFGTNLKNNNPTLAGPWTGVGTMKGIILYPNQQCRQQMLGYTVNEGLQLVKSDFQGDVSNTPTIASMGSFFAGRPVSISSLAYRDTIFLTVTEFSNKNLVAIPLLPLPAGSEIKNYDPAVTHTFTTPGVHTVTLMVDPGNPAGSATYCTTITIVGVPDKPTPFTAAPATVCRNASNVTYTVPAVTGATSYEWSYTGGTGATFGNATTTLPSNTVNFSGTATSGTIRVRAVNSAGSGPYRDTAITVNAAPDQPGAFTAAPATVCQGQSNVTYTVPNVAGVTYSWSYTGGAGATITGSGNSVTVDFNTSATNGTLQVTATNSCGTSAPRTTGITVNPLPAQPGAFTAAPTSVCRGQNNVTYTVPNVAGVTYNWSYTGGTGAAITGSGNSVTVDFSTSATSGTLQVTATNSCGTSAPRTAGITVNPLPVAAITPAGPVDICENDTVTLTAGSGTGYSYQWKNGGANVGTGNIYAAYATGSYKVVVTGTGNCMDSTQEVAVTVYSRPSGTLAPGDTAFCEGGVVTLGVSTTDTGLSYRWKNGSATIPLATADFLEVHETGVYTVVLNRTHITGGCADTTAAVTVTVHPTPEPDVTWDGLTLHADGGYASYQWNTGGQGIAGATDSTFQPAADGGYSVTVADGNGCSATSPVYNLTVGISGITMTAAQVQVYPNPSGDIVHIAAPQTVHVFLSSMDGKVLLQQQDVRAIDISPYADGVYLLKITDRNGAVIRTDRLVKALR